MGLLTATPRSESGQRQYGAPAVQRLAFIRRCREFGFTIEQVRELADPLDSPARPCVEVRQVAADHLTTVRHKLLELHALESGLTRVVASCDTACADGSVVNCAILEDLAVSVEHAADLGHGGCCAA